MHSVVEYTCKEVKEQIESAQSITKRKGDFTMDNVKRFCAGRLIKEDEGLKEDFYYDTRFSSIEEAIMWGAEHECTHIYDSIADEFYAI